ncbi:MAG: hypothetical protein ACKO0Z_07300 [Betaproteobacteria bacterium]
MAKKKKEDKPKSYVETCAPKQNGCTKAGVGPNCMESGANGLVNDGAEQKRDCLKEAKKSCEDKLDQCLKKCEEDRKKAIEYMKSFGGAIPRLVGTRAYCSQDDITNGLGPYLAASSSIGIVSTIGPMNWRPKHADCIQYCYRQAASDCSTTQCYCGSFKCTITKKDDETTGKTDDPVEDEEVTDKTPNSVSTSNTTNRASMVTTSAYNIPIEIVYSRAFMPGNVLWFGNVDTQRTSTTRTSFDAVANTTRTATTISVTNKVDLILGVCSGEIGSIEALYVDGKKSRIDYDTELGSSAQKVMKEHAEQVGFGYAPAYRNTALMVLRDFDVTPYTKFPTLKIEVISNNTDDPLVVETAAQTGLDSSNIWTVDPVAGRVFYEAVHKVRCSKYETLETVWDEVTDNAVEITPIGNIITRTSGKYNVYYPHMSREYGDYTARASTKTFLFPVEAMTGDSYLGLFSFNSAGDLYVEKIDEVRGTISAGPSIVGFDTEPPKCAFKQTCPRSGVSPGNVIEETSVFFLRLKTGTSDTVRINEARLISGNAGSDFLENGEKYTYDLPTSYFGNTAGLTLLGAVPVADSSILIFTKFGTTNRIIKWNREDGRVWSTDVESLPDFGRYGQVRITDSDTFAFIAPDDNTYIVDVTTGNATQYVDTLDAFPGLLDGKQYYDSETNSITYQSEDSRITRIYLDRKSTVNATMKSAIEDVCYRSGIDLLYVDADSLAIREVTGFRSGDNTTGAEILFQLSEVYPSVILSSDKVIGLKRSSTVGGTVDSEHYEHIPPTAQSIEHKEDTKVSVTYFASALNGDIATQSFTLDTIYKERLVQQPKSEFKYTVLETDTYMRQLAELKSYLLRFDQNVRKVSLPPRYLAFTVGDLVTDDQTRRISKLTIGANNWVEVEAKREQPDVYDDIVQLTGIDGLPLSFSSREEEATFHSPMSFTLRGVDSALPLSSYAFVGASNALDEFTDTATMTRVSSLTRPVPTSSAFIPSDPMIWGKLETLPPTLGSSIFRTFTDHSFKVRFPSTDFVARILAKESFYGSFPDQRTLNPYYNLIVVGYEQIQYGYAEADSDPNVVVFHDLLRARSNTDDSLTHSLGEFCAIVDDAVQMHRIDSTVIEAPAKFATTTSAGYFRTNGAKGRTADLLPPTPYLITRQDYTPNPGAMSSLYPANPHIGIFVDVRRDYINGFSDSVVNVSNPYTRVEMYLLRAAYDPILFNAERYGTGTTYIMRRVTSESNVDFGEVGSPIFANGTIWPAYLHDSVTFNYLTQPLVAVIINVNDFGETRAVASWNAGGYFKDRTHRGLNA